MTKIPVTGKSGSEMDYLEAELDLASIDNVDVRNELRRFTVFSAIGWTLNSWRLIVTSV